ncbi:MAG TPA: hypothetical protein VF718_03180 [Allosphingosinicella sp.]|jgi:hypothetical protein
MTEHSFEEVVVRKETIRLEHRDVPIESIVLDEDNPRLRYLHQKEENKDKTPEDIIREMPDASRLRKDIEQNGGLRERVILTPLSNGKFKSVEGNRRRVAVGDLHAKNKSDTRWKTMPARVLPADFDPKKLAIMLADWHVINKVRWDPHEKAGHVYRMNKDLGIPLDEIATTLHASKTTVTRIMKGYAFMMERFLTIDGGAYKEIGEGKWSFFDELHRSKELIQRLTADPDFGDDFCRWVGEGRLAQPVQVRKLAKILAHPEARKVFEKTGANSAFAGAQRIIETAEPEEGSDFFKQLGKMRENFRSAAQVKEILRIRKDPVARKRLLETYEAMVDFMHLADVDVPTDRMEDAA